MDLWSGITGSIGTKSDCGIRIRSGRAHRLTAAAFSGVGTDCLRGSGDEDIARQQLDALQVDPRKLCAVSAVCCTKQRPPICRVIGPSGAKVLVSVLGDRVDGGDRERAQNLDDGLVETEEDVGRARIGTNGSPGGNECCASDGQRDFSRKCGLMRRFADSPLGVMRNLLPPGRIAKVEVQEQERTPRGSIAACGGAREKLPL